VSRKQELKWPKTYLTYDVAHKKLKTKKNIFHYRLDDLPNLLRGWTAL